MQASGSLPLLRAVEELRCRLNQNSNFDAHHSSSSCQVQSGARSYLRVPTSFPGLRPNKQTFNPADTNALVAAVAFGKGLSNWRPSGSSGPGQPGQPGAGTILAASGLQQVQMAGAPGQQQPMLSGVQVAQTGQPGKVLGVGMWRSVSRGEGTIWALSIPGPGDSFLEPETWKTVFRQKRSPLEYLSRRRC